MQRPGPATVRAHRDKHQDRLARAITTARVWGCNFRPAPAGMALPAGRGDLQQQAKETARPNGLIAICNAWQYFPGAPRTPTRGTSTFTSRRLTLIFQMGDYFFLRLYPVIETPATEPAAKSNGMISRRRNKISPIGRQQTLRSFPGGPNWPAGQPKSRSGPSFRTKKNMLGCVPRFRCWQKSQDRRAKFGAGGKKLAGLSKPVWGPGTRPLGAKGLFQTAMVFAQVVYSGF